VKKPQWITIGVAIILTLTIYVFGRTVAKRDNSSAQAAIANANMMKQAMSTDSVLAMARQKLSPEQAARLTSLENSVTRGNVKDQQLSVYNQLSQFWGDTMRIFQPYAWYKAEAARLENSEKSLTFAARLFLEYLQQEPSAELRQWEALQAKDLFERSLRINPRNDSARVGIGACYLFGNISPMPMEGITKIREVLQDDSTNVYAHMTLVKGSLMSGQFDKAVERLATVNRLQPDNVEAILLTADTYEQMKENKKAAEWYTKSLPLIPREEIKQEVQKRIEELGK